MRATALLLVGVLITGCSNTLVDLTPHNTSLYGVSFSDPDANNVRPSAEFYAAPPKRIATIVMDWPAGPTRHVEDLFIRALLTKGFRVVSRSDIEPLLEEMRFQRRSGLTDRDAAELGKMLNVPAVLVVAIASDASFISVGARLVTVQGAEIVWADTRAEWRAASDDYEAVSFTAGQLADTLPEYPNY